MMPGMLPLKLLLVLQLYTVPLLVKVPVVVMAAWLTIVPLLVTVPPFAMVPLLVMVLPESRLSAPSTLTAWSFSTVKSQAMVSVPASTLMSVMGLGSWTLMSFVSVSEIFSLRVKVSLVVSVVSRLVLSVMFFTA